MNEFKIPTFGEHMNERLDVTSSVFSKVSKLLQPNFIDLFRDVEGNDEAIMLIVDLQVDKSNLKKAFKIIEKGSKVEILADFPSVYTNAEGEDIDVTYYQFGN